MREVIFDNCVLSNFALSDSLYIVKKLYQGVSYITDFTAAENMRGIAQGYGALEKFREALREGWIREVTLNSNKEKALFESLSVSLGSGEASSIAAAKVRGFIFACDDKAARREAALLQVALTGTLGILARAVKEKIISVQNADDVLNLMIKHGFYAPVSSMREIL